jgi:ankyrin repeat protein
MNIQAYRSFHHNFEFLKQVQTKNYINILAIGILITTSIYVVYSIAASFWQKYQIKQARSSIARFYSKPQVRKKDQIFWPFPATQQEHRAANKIKKAFKKFVFEWDERYRQGREAVTRKEQKICLDKLEEVSQLFQYSFTGEFSNGSLSVKEAKALTKIMKNDSFILTKQANCAEYARALYMLLFPELSSQTRERLHICSIEHEDHALVAILSPDGNHSFWDPWGHTRDLLPEKNYRNLEVKATERQRGFHAKSRSFLPLLRTFEDDVFIMKGFEHIFEMTTISETSYSEYEKELKVMASHISPIREAAHKGDEAQLTKFLNKSPIDKPDYAGDTLLHLAVSAGHLKIVKLLKDKGYNVNLENHAGFSPFMLAIRKGYLDIVLLLSDKVDPQKRAKDGDTLLHLAARYGQEPIVKALFEIFDQKNLDINAVNHNGETPLLLASQKGDLPTVRELLQYSANIRIFNKENDTPLSIAFKRNREPVVTFLTQYILNHKQIKDEDKVHLLTACTEKGVAIVYVALGKLFFEPVVSFLNLIKNSTLSHDHRAKIFKLEKYEDLDIIQNILAQYPKQENFKTVFTLATSSIPFDKQTFKTLIEIIDELDRPRFARARKRKQGSVLQTIAHAIAHCVQTNPHKQKEIKQIFLSHIQSPQDSTLIYHQLVNQDSRRKDIKQALILIKFFQEFLDIAELNQLLTRIDPTSGVELHGLLIALTKNSFLLEELEKILPHNKAKELYQFIIQTQTPFITQKKPLSLHSDQLDSIGFSMGYDDSGIFWASMEKALTKINARMNSFT